VQQRLKTAKTAEIPVSLLQKVEIRLLRLTSRLQPQAKCPQCSRWADCGEAQVLGEEAVICPCCGWYGFRDTTKLSRVTIKLPRRLSEPR
jgi:hypothetical protein